MTKCQPFIFPDILKPVANTMQLHQVISTSQKQLLVKKSSCYCYKCVLGLTCDSGLSLSVNNFDFPTHHDIDEACSTSPNISCTQKQTVDLNDNIVGQHEVGKWYAVFWTKTSHWFVGMLRDIVVQDQNVSFEFLHQKLPGRNYFISPFPKDIAVIHVDDIFYRLQHSPVSVHQSGALILN